MGFHLFPAYLGISFVHVLHFSSLDETDAVSSNFGSTMSIPGSPAEPASTKEGNVDSTRDLRDR